MRFGKKGKLSPRFIGSFEILRRVGEVAYEITLPLSLAGVHLVFHVSMLWRYHGDPSHVLEDLSYVEEPVAILARQAVGEGTRTVPKTRKEYNGADLKAIEKNFKAKKILMCGIGPDEYNRISACESAKEIWEAL
ncbi:uncharacterized protein [Nicotiana sylvestris]|uniref:uncharacterized protein n=1 Tax=Nicotiana sylvestris TaxID=4096 RepID=UPI00388C4B0F